MRSLRLLPLLAAFLSQLLAAAATAVHQATGFKLTEPGATSITVWTRVTRDPEAAGNDRSLPRVTVIDRTSGAEQTLKDNAAYPNGKPQIVFPTGSDWGSIRGAALGAPGQTRVRYRTTGTGGWQTTAWRDVDVQRDCTAVFQLAGLTPQTRYEVMVDARPAGSATNTEPTSTQPGTFTTAPAPRAAAPAKFAVMSCQQYEDIDRPDGLAIYPAMLRGQPDFFVNTGDAVYYDHGPVHALNDTLARYHWARMYALPTLRDFHRQVGSFFMKDDHDTLTNDSHPGDRTGDFTFDDGLRIFREQTAPAEPPYRAVRWGRHLEVWLLEGRDTRSSTAADRTGVPTILGPEQVAWLERTLAASDATFRVLITPTPIVGPDRTTKDDNLSNAGYRQEGERIRALLARHRNLIVITGDRHWQYVSRDPSTGVEEWSVGAASDAHAGGWNEDKPRAQHRFLRIKHGGYLSGEVSSAGTGATLTLRLHDTAGTVVFADTKNAP
jgi:alkaline phosphatase D